MSKQRLIDADALNKELQKRVGSPTDDKLYEANLVIIEQPTIAAIPVEWIQAQIENEKRAPLFRRYADALLTIWQKEQEAR